MKRKILALVGIVFCIFTIPLTVWADSQTFTPPAEKGKIYVIVEFTDTFAIVPKDVRVTVRWGGWQKSGTFHSGGGRTPKKGFVIRLDHKKNDSVALTVNTSAGGNIVNIYQGGEPSQKGNGDWHYAVW